jgi:hypothetical protein
VPEQLAAVALAVALDRRVEPCIGGSACAQRRRELVGQPGTGLQRKSTPHAPQRVGRHRRIAGDQVDRGDVVRQLDDRARRGRRSIPSRPCPGCGIRSSGTTCSPPTRAAFELVRERVAFMDRDRCMDADIAATVELIASGQLSALIGAP